MKSISKADKTIVVEYDDLSRMMDECSVNDTVSKDFLDWYLLEDSIPMKTGIVLLKDSILAGRTPLAEEDFESVDKSANPKEWRRENITSHEDIIPIEFDFTDPNEVFFTVYDYKLQRVCAKYSFKRADNMTLEEPELNMEFYSYGFFLNTGPIIIENSDSSKAFGKRIVQMVADYCNRNGKKVSRREGVRLYHRFFREEVKKNVIRGHNEFFSASIGWIYAMMYYFAKNIPKEVKMSFPQGTAESEFVKEIKRVYKYYGYINLSKSVVYHPLMNKNPDEPKREYQRHIQKWSVRGHYRKLSNGELKWIEPFLKGKGELEKRVYGTEELSEINIVPKVFEIVKQVKVNSLTVLKPEVIPVKMIEMIPKSVEKVFYRKAENKKSFREQVLFIIIKSFNKLRQWVKMI